LKRTLCLVSESIDELIRTVRANPLMYFSESDLQSELFSILLGRFNSEEAIKNILVWGTDNPGTPRIVFSRRLHSELLLPGGRIDLAVLDLDKVRMAINSKGRFGHIQLDPGRHVFIEIKASRTNRRNISSKNHWINLILADIKKLHAYSHPCFLLCFDFNKLLEDDAVSSPVRSVPSNLEVSYVRDDMHNYCFEDDGLTSCRSAPAPAAQQPLVRPRAGITMRAHPQ